MRGDLTVEHENLAIRHQAAEMVIGSAIAEPELKDHAREIRDPLRRGVQTVALGGDTENHEFEAAWHWLSDLPNRGGLQGRYYPQGKHSGSGTDHCRF